MTSAATSNARPTPLSRACAVAFRVLFISLVFTALGMALGLFAGIFLQILRSLSGSVDMTVAYRHVAFPTAVTFGSAALIAESVLEYRASHRNTHTTRS